MPTSVAAAFNVFLRPLADFVNFGFHHLGGRRDDTDCRDDIFGFGGATENTQTTAEKNFASGCCCIERSLFEK